MAANINTKNSQCVELVANFRTIRIHYMYTGKAIVTDIFPA